MSRGDEEALREFYEMYCDRLYGFIFYRVGADHPITEDLTQETFLSALKALHAFQGEASLFTWLCAIARHKIADHYRQLRRGDFNELGLQVIEPPRLTENFSPEEDLGKRQDIEHAYVALRKLPALYRQVLMLKYIDEWPVNRIASEIERTPKATESLLTRARVALRMRLVEMRSGKESAG